MVIFLKKRIALRKKWSLRSQIQFFSYIHHYIEYGIPLIETIQLLQATFPKRYQSDFQLIFIALNKGERFHQIFSRLQFEADIVSIFEAGNDVEKSKHLFQKCAHLLEQKQQFQQFVKKLFAYPVFLLLLVVISGVFISQTILPQYADIVPNNGTGFSTIYLLINYFFQWIPLILAVFSMALIGFLFCLPYLPIRIRVTLLRVSQMLPIYGNISKKFQSYYLLQLLLSTLKSQLTLSNGIALFTKSKNKLTQYQARYLENGFCKGNFLHETIHEMGLFDQQFEAVLFHAQTHGHLLKELEGFSVLLKEQMHEIVQKGLRIFQVFTFLLVGLYIFALYGAVLLPMYALFETF